MATTTRDITNGADLEAWVRLARAGDLPAFEQVYRACAGRVHALCLRLVSDGTRAQELTQDVFVRLWEKLPTFREESAFTTWLHRLTVNLVTDRLRSESRRAAWLIPMDELPEAETLPNSGLRQTTRRLNTRRLEEAIAALPEGARAVLVLHDIEGLRHQEIAEALSISEGTSKAQLHRARRRLRKVLEP